MLEELGWTSESVSEQMDRATLLEFADLMRSFPIATYSSDEAAEILGVPPAELDRIRRQFQLAPRPAEGPVWAEEDLTGIRLLFETSERFSSEEVGHFARVVGSSLARISDAAISLFLIDMEGPERMQGATELDVARLNVEVGETLDGFVAAVPVMLQLHLSDAARRSRSAREGDDDPHLSTMAVGFVDLVGFTAFSERSTVAEIGRLIREFEDAAFDLVSDHNGRVVKLIGDEVMFVAPEAEQAAKAAISLISEFRRNNALPRGGLAYGDLLTRGGDYYGPIVNLASRIGDLAVPRELLVTPEVAVRCPGFDWEPAGRRQLKGFEQPVSLVSLSC